MADTLIREAIAYGSQPLSPVPQYWNGVSYEKVEGDNGSAYASIIGSAGDTARFTGANPGSVQLTATTTVNFSGTGTVNFSGTGTVQLYGSYAVNSESVCTATVTWTSGTTATSSQTVTISALGTTTTVSHEVFITNDGPYDIAATIYKTISAGSTISTDIGVSFTVPAIVTTAGITVGAKSAQVQGLYNVNLGGTIRLTLTAAITATVTNYVLIKELDI
jgi:hypothetical protein